MRKPCLRARLLEAKRLLLVDGGLRRHGHVAEPFPRGDDGDWVRTSFDGCARGLTAPEIS
jgi:hypothetical protein